MDFISHLLIGLIASELLVLPGIQAVLLLVGSVLPDLSVLVGYAVLGPRAKGVYVDDPVVPVWIRHLYDFLHSVLFMLVLLVLHLVYPPLRWLAVGVLMHVVIDLFSHKRYVPRVLFPLAWQPPGVWEWAQTYYSLRSRLVVWVLLVFLYLLAVLFGPATL